MGDALHTAHYSTKVLIMTALITATFLVSTAYFALAFVAHIAKSVGDRRRNTAPIDLDFAALSAELSEEMEVFEKALLAPSVIFVPAPVVQAANLYQQCNIRQLKKLASGRVKSYSKLTKPQLIAALT